MVNIDKTGININSNSVILNELINKNNEIRKTNIGTIKAYIKGYITRKHLKKNLTGSSIENLHSLMNLLNI